MPPRGWKRLSTESSVMQSTEWKRLFFAEGVFQSVEDLVHAAVMGGTAKAYVEALLALGHAKKKRKTLSMVAQSLTGGERPNWLSGVLSSVWLIYSAEVSMWKQRIGEDLADLGTVTKKQRKILRGTGWVTVRRPSLKVVADERRSDAVKRCGGTVFLCWVDNFNKFRYSRNPNEDRDRCINATVLAVLPSNGVRRVHWSGWPTSVELFEQVDFCGRALTMHHKQFSDRIRNLVDKRLTFQHIRVPCDLRRTGVTSVPWTPFRLVNADIKSTAGLVTALEHVLRLQRSTMGLCCMLMDVNIFWRVLRLVYSCQYIGCNVMGELADCVPVLGIWHAYAHCVKKVYEHFMPVFAALEIPGFLRYPEESVVYCKPRLIVMEHMVMGIFLQSPATVSDIKNALADIVQCHGTDSEPADQCRAVLYLVTEYVPALVEMGISVRQCFWRTQDSNTGNVARQTIRDAIVLLQSLCSGGTTEYIRNLMLMDLLWSTLHAALPAAYYVEECLESSLSVLARRTRTDARATTIDDFSDIYTRTCTKPINVFLDLIRSGLKLSIR